MITMAPARTMRTTRQPTRNLSPAVHRAPEPASAANHAARPAATSLSRRAPGFRAAAPAARGHSPFISVSTTSRLCVRCISMHGYSDPLRTRT